eukprot:m.17269 g.17269  ORF g.17269 m.17269 type:complete len:1248 (-) comp11415_c0_seq1:76-3819(-)
MMRNASKVAACASVAGVVAVVYKMQLAKAKAKAKAKASKIDSPKEKKRKQKDYFSAMFKLMMSKVTKELGWIAALCICRTLLNDRLARLQGWLFKATFLKDVPNFINFLAQDFVFNFTFSCLKSTIEYRTASMALKIRGILNSKIEADYFRSMTYYKVSFVDKRIQAPEHVIVDDTETVSNEMSEIALLWIGALIDGTYWTWRNSGEIGVKWATIPLVYIIAAVGLSQAVSPNFGQLFSLKQKAETALRFAFSNFRSNTEAIAAFGGGEREHDLIESRTNTVVEHSWVLLQTQCWFGMVEDFIAKYGVTTVASFVIMAPYFGDGTYTDIAAKGHLLSKMRYTTSATVYQLYAVGGLAMVVQKSMKLKSAVNRLGELMDVIKSMREDFKHQHNTSVVPGEHIEFKDVEVETPSGHSLVKNLNFKITPGSNLLITGPNGSGKSSIFRCLGSLWKVKHGTIMKPSMNSEGLCGDVFYLPQKPYSVVGDLRDQLTYPVNTDTARNSITDEMLSKLLTLVDLEYLTDRSNANNVNWENELSLGEVQRLAMARLFYHRPTYAILDECTSAVSTDMEVRLYRICAEMGITCVTISHRPALQAFHSAKLELDGRGNYDVQTLHDDGNVDLSFTDDGAQGTDATDTNSPGRPRAKSESRDDKHAVATYSALSCESLKAEDSSMIANFKRLAQMVWSRNPQKSISKLGVLTSIVIARVYLSDRIAHNNGNLIKSVLNSDWDGFVSIIGAGVWQSAMQAVLAPSLLYVARSLALDWRETISRHLFQKYFRNKAYYKISNLYHLVEDSDYRLTQDLDKLSTELARIFPDIVKPFADITWFTYQALLILGLRNTSLLYMYMLGGFGVLRLVTPAFGELTRKSQELTSAFKYVHTRLRTHGESVAFFGGDEVEGKICNQHYKSLVVQRKKQLNLEWQHGIFNDFIIKQLPPIVTWALSFIYTMQLAKTLDIYSDNGGQLTHDLRYVSTVVSHTFLAFGDLLDLYKRVVELSGYASRVVDVERGLTAVKENTLRDATAGTIIPSDDVIFENVDIVTPTGDNLVAGLNCVVPNGQNLLLTGPNVSGKSSLFRVLGGLWPLRRGTLHRPVAGPDESDTTAIFMVPQRPYNAIGSLAQQLTYPVIPDLHNETTVALLHDLLASVGLAYLVEREKGWDAVANWADVLSLGEQQRLGMARLFYHKPKFAVLDQCTDAVSVDVEEELYDRAKQYGITIITISQRPGLVGHHDQHLQLNGKGSWQLKSI